MESDVVWIESNTAVPTPVERTIREMSDHFGVTPRTLRFYESRGLISPRREFGVRLYSQRDADRLALVLKAKKFGFTLVEISGMVDAAKGSTDAPSLKLGRDKCLEQIRLLEAQVRECDDAIAELRRIHTMLSSRAPR
jgi:DNA-binding transcriptional MerR regulator